MRWEEVLHRPTTRYSAAFRRFADYAFKQATRSHVLPPYRGRVIAFKADTRVDWRGNDARDALVAACVPGARVVDVPGNHAGCLRAPHVEKLAELLAPVLA